MIHVQGQRVKGQGHMVNVHRAPEYSNSLAISEFLSEA